jgi:hypothetical protein
MSMEEVRGALYDVTRTIDHLRISLAAVCQVTDSWASEQGSHRESLRAARQRISDAVEKLKPIAQDLQAAFYAFEETTRNPQSPAEPRSPLSMSRDARAAS